MAEAERRIEGKRDPGQRKRRSFVSLQAHLGLFACLMILLWFCQPRARSALSPVPRPNPPPLPAAPKKGEDVGAKVADVCVAGVFCDGGLLDLIEDGIWHSGGCH
jgi:hypothetical protein